jgi:hypothetical protein
MTNPKAHPALTSLLAALAVLPLAAGCTAPTEAEADSAPRIPPSDPEPQLPRGTSLFLEIQDPYGQPIPRAIVTIPLPSLPDGGVGVIAFDTLAHLHHPTRMSSEGIEYRADSAGHLLLEDLQQLFGDRLVLRVEAPGFAPASVVLEGLSTDAHIGARAILQPIAVTRLFDTRSGLDLQHDGIRVQIPANGVVDRDGNSIDGLVELQLAPFDAADRLDEHPGPLVADNSHGQRVSLETYAMAEISLWQEGRPLQLAPGAHATLELPLPETWLADPDAARRPRPGDTIPAWWFDLNAGIWREEGVGIVRADPNDPDRIFWTTEVAHFTWWNADNPWTTHSCFLITVHKNGVPQKGVTVQAIGKSYNGASAPVVTDDQGQACTAIMLGGVATVYVGDLQDPLVPPFDIEGKHGPAACDGNGETCKGRTINLGGDDKDTCAPGAYIPCPYSGPPGTEDVGICQAGYDYCGVNSKWLGCEGEQIPLPEDPNSDEDEDCNGDPYNGASTCTQKDQVKECYEGDPGTLQVGICASGIKECQLDQDNNLLWSECKGQVLPDKQADDCFDPDIDSNCDGSPSCGYAEWAAAATGPSDVSLSAVAVASDGTIYVTGQFLGQLELAGQVLNNPTPTPHTLLAKLLPDGTLAGLHSLGAGLSGEHELVARGTDHIYLSASLTGALSTGACQAQGHPAGAVALLRLDQANLACNTVKNFGDGISTQIPSALATGGAQLLVAGRYRGQIAGVSSPPNQYATFLLTLDPSLNQQTAETFTSNWEISRPTSPVLAANSAGYALGFVFTGILILDGQSHISGAIASLFLLHRDAKGQTEWAVSPQAYEIDLPDAGLGVGLTANGRVNVAFPAPSGDLRLQQWANAEAHVWSHDLSERIPAPQRGGVPLVVAPNGDIALHTQSTADPSLNTVARRSTDGQVIWLQTYLGQGQPPTESAAIAFAPDLNQRLIISGRTREPQLVIPNNLNLMFGGGGWNGYIARLNP